MKEQGGDLYPVWARLIRLRSSQPPVKKVCEEGGGMGNVP